MRRIDTRSLKFVLASASPRRRDLFALLGLAFECRPCAVEEGLKGRESPVSFAERTAVAKARAASREGGREWVVGADTVAALGGTILGKPRDRDHALEILRLLNGKTHRVITGVAVLDPRDRTVETGARITAVTFERVPESRLAAYAGTGEPLDKAGAYGIQGEGRTLVRSIEGCYHNVVGLPLCLVMEILRRFGIEGGDAWRHPALLCCGFPPAAPERKKS